MAGHSQTARTQALPAERARQGGGPGFGLGIDAGGTYTDVAVLDFRDSSVLAKSKSLTTKWDYTEGIEAALGKVPEAYLEPVALVSVSTTLATNAVVEHQGQRVGVLLMPPYGRFQDWELPHNPKAVVQGQMDLDGKVMKPVNPVQVERVARAMVRDHDVKAFVVSGSGATVNAAHELEVMRILRDTTGLGVTCGHTLSDMLGMYRRAVTAIFNARVVPYIEAFLENLQTALAARGIEAPVMVVKGDGTLVSAAMAKERPVETIFSGPAASVAGARKLTQLADALVVDIGGTTTDIAAIRNDRVEVRASGSVIAGVHTHVRALDMRTRGLGGDSAITPRGGEVAIGPVRVTPVSFLASEFPGVAQALDFVEGNTDAFRTNPGAMQLLALTRHREPLELEPVEKDTLGVLARRPHSVEEIARTLELPYRGAGLFARLLRHNVITASALTPTDVLHALDRVHLWDSAAARRVCQLHAGLMGLTADAFTRLVLDTFTRDLALELFRKVMGGEPDEADSSPSSRAVIRKWLHPSEDGLAITMTLPHPIIGVGAPARELLPEAARLFNTTVAIPCDYDVANAIGAITSAVRVSKSVKIAPRESGRFAIWGLADEREFEDLHDAVDRAKAQLAEEMRELARRAGVRNPRVEMSVADETVTDGYGGTTFLGTVITANVTDVPEP